MPKVLPSKGDVIEIDTFPRPIEITDQDGIFPDILLATDDAGNLHPVYISYLYSNPNSWKFIEEKNKLGTNTSPPINIQPSKSTCSHNWIHWDSTFDPFDYCKDCGVKKGAA